VARPLSLPSWGTAPRQEQGGQVLVWEGVVPWGGGHAPSRGDEAGGEVAPDKACPSHPQHGPRSFVPQFPHPVIEEQVLPAGKLQASLGEGVVGQR